MKTTSKKHRKKCENQGFWLPKPSQNDSKMPSKSMFQKTCDFAPIFARKSFCRDSADIDFVLVFPIQNGSRTLFFTSLFLRIFVLKNLQKTLQKPGPNPSKIGTKNMLLLSIGFLGFGLPFWSFLGFQVEAKLIQNRHKSGLGVLRVWSLKPS